MQQQATQAEWIQGAITVEQSGAEARRAFIQKTYVHFLIGLMAFCGITAAVLASPLVASTVDGELRAGPLAHPYAFIGSLIMLIVWQMMYGRLFSSPKMSTHYIGYGVTIVLEAVLCAPLFWIAHNFVGDGILRNAFMLTALGFGGLTAFTLASKRDFSFMGGFLSMATMILLGIALLSLFFGGFNMGLLWSAIVIVIFGGWVVYHTDQIKQHLPLNGYVFGATMLFIDFVVILRQVVWILMSLANND